MEIMRPENRQQCYNATIRHWNQLHSHFCGNSKHNPGVILKLPATIVLGQLVGDHASATQAFSSVVHSNIYNINWSTIRQNGSHTQIPIDASKINHSSESEKVHLSFHIIYYL